MEKQQNTNVIRGYDKKTWEELSTQTVFNGNLIIVDLRVNENRSVNINSLPIKKINGNLIIINCILADQLSNIMQVSGSMSILNSNIGNLKKLKSVSKRLEINNSQVANLSSLISVGEDFITEKSLVQNCNVKYVGGSKKFINKPLPENLKYLEQ